MCVKVSVYMGGASAGYGHVSDKKLYTKKAVSRGAFGFEKKVKNCIITFKHYNSETIK